MRINTSGNVGIGTNAPTRNLHIRSAEPGIRMESSGNIQIRAWDIKRGVGQYADLYFIESFTGGIIVDPADIPDTCLTLTRDRRVGIGTANPAEALDVNGRVKSGALSMGPWPANASNFVFWGTNALNQSSSENYALLQGTTGSNLGRTYLNSPLDIRFRIKNSDKMVLDANGNVGIGIASPAQELHVFKSGTNADIRLQTDLATNYLDVFCGNNRAGLFGYDKASLEFATDGKLRMFISGTDGRIGIGTSNPQSTLAVNGKITAKEVEVTLNGWADFVFKPDYKLLPLSEVEKFIKEHRHLPGVPSETEILSKNQNLGEMNALLMQKIEELTLYVIELKKELEEVKKSK